MTIPTPVSSQYCLPQETQLILEKKIYFFCAGSTVYTIEDIEENLVFDVQKPGWGSKRLLRDRSGQPIMLLKARTYAWSSVWTGYRGTDSNDANELFSFSTRLSLRDLKVFKEVYLPTNTGRDASGPDFVIKYEKVWLRVNYTVLYQGREVAKAEEKGLNYLLRVSPGVDRAFISALFIMKVLQMRRQA
jgi:hypothetical protein